MCGSTWLSKCFYYRTTLALAHFQVFNINKQKHVSTLLHNKHYAINMLIASTCNTQNYSDDIIFVRGRKLSRWMREWNISWTIHLGIRAILYYTNWIIATEFLDSSVHIFNGRQRRAHSYMFSVYQSTHELSVIATREERCVFVGTSEVYFNIRTISC